MRHNRIWTVGILLVLAGMLLAGCSRSPVVTASTVPPAIVEKIEGTELNRVTLTEQAAKRLGIQTDVVREEKVNDATRLIMPYSAVIYDLQGGTWVYTSSAPLTYARQAITVDYIEGDRAVLTAGPEAGTTVVTVGVAELYGADTGVGK